MLVFVLSAVVFFGGEPHIGFVGLPVGYGVIGGGYRRLPEATGGYRILLTAASAT
jgi:hypothetical protein